MRPRVKRDLTPRNTPAEIIDKLSREINAALADPKAKARIADLGRLRSLARSPTSGGSTVDD